MAGDGLPVEMTDCGVPFNLKNSIKSAKVLLVGAGGIGCEVLKNLTLTEFGDIVVVSLSWWIRNTVGFNPPVENPATKCSLCSVLIESMINGQCNFPFLD